MGERLLCKQEGVGSIPITSTIQMTDDRKQMSEWGAELGKGRRFAGGQRSRAFVDGRVKRELRVRRVLGRKQRSPGARESVFTRPLPAAICLTFAVGRGEESSAKEGHLVDALALRGDEGRGTLRKARGRGERSLIPGSPNGATHPKGYPVLNS